MNILNQLADYAKERVKRAEQNLPLEEVRKQALGLSKDTFSFEKAIGKKELSFICECKKASPSKGLIAPDFPYLQIAKEYEAAGADCISVLTEPKWFLGSDDYLKEIAGAVSIPCLRKDFIVDEYMIYEARLLGAAAVLLICSILDGGHSRRLRESIPKEVLFVSESGIRSPEDIQRLREIHADGVLIGEALMRAADKKAELARLRAAFKKIFGNSPALSYPAPESKAEAG